ncbi:hypothetical protein A5709_07100 [Mycobacterium sp. E1386]|uniref:hypothetical protein n=1 Tax=unclassified Mycobacterium TaxID=2642494 RepID=UPI0007FD68D5|nr:MULTISPECIES: hypothetical protein [unclassified Mycobacterium]OBI24176.1 hypothetical protein A5711_08635 [Mycobacterium sp. E2238]OBI26545.1 hypothetical protein A5709_07100 [Mycobacterium sp. E1386]
MADTVKVTLDRASVAMGDDVESHRVFWVFPDSATVDDLLVAVSRYVPGVAGPAGWMVDVNTGDRVRRRDLGIIYTRDDLRQEDQICRLTAGNTTLGDLARWAKVPDLDVYARYLTWDMGRPLALSEVTAAATYTGAQPTKLQSEAEAQANTDWVLTRELDRRAAEVAAMRRDWIRANIIAGSTPPPGTDIFIARNFHYLADLHCPASMDVAAQLLLGTDEAQYENLSAAIDIDARPAMVTLAMVLAAFEWHTAYGSWQAGGRPYLKPYFEYLAGCGYRLSPIEQVMAGQITAEQLKFSQGDIARLNRIRQLRDLQYQLRTNRYYAKTLTEEQYRAAITSVHAELSALGELPGPM